MPTQLQASKVHVLFEPYFTPSIKDYEHSQRFDSARLNYTIAELDQVRKSDFAKELKNLNLEVLLDMVEKHDPEQE